MDYIMSLYIDTEQILYVIRQRKQCRGIIDQMTLRLFLGHGLPWFQPYFPLVTCGFKEGKAGLCQPGSITSSDPIHGAAIFPQLHHVPQVYLALNVSWPLRCLSLWYVPLLMSLTIYSLTH